MEVVEEILASIGVEGVEEMAVNENYTIEVDGYEDLTIEKIAENRVSVAHHDVQRGDLMCDPEIVFRVEDGDWTPVEYTQHPHTHQHDSTGLDITDFVDRWSENLRKQGFADSPELNHD